LREVGGVLLLDVNYDNTGKMRPGIPGLGSPDNFGLKQITYMYRPYFLPSNKNTKFELVQGSDHADERVVDVWYGITVRMQFNGQLVVFDWNEVLKTLTTGLTLLSAASALVLLTATFLLPLKEKYGALIYQMSEDYGDFKNVVAKHAGKTNVQSDFFTGDMLSKFVGTDGKVKPDGGGITATDVLKALTMCEVRLNRLDAQDPRMILDDAEDMNKGSGALFAKCQNEFYGK